MNFLRDLAERTLTTYVEALLTFLLLAPTLDVSLVVAALIAALPAGFSALKAILLEWLGKTPAPKTIGVALAERMLATYVATFAGLVISNPGEVATYKLAAVSSITAVLAVVKGILATGVGHRTTSLDPERTTP